MTSPSGAESRASSTTRATTRRATACSRPGPNADRDLYRQLRLDNRLIGNISADALDINSDAVADAVITFAMDTSMLP